MALAAASPVLIRGSGETVQVLGHEVAIDELVEGIGRMVNGCPAATVPTGNYAAIIDTRTNGLFRVLDFGSISGGVAAADGRAAGTGGGLPGLGIEVSPDGRRLYVNESVQRRVWAYDIDAGGGVSGKRLLIAFDDHGLDGMRTDERGNLYIARYGAGTVAIVSPQGTLLREVALAGRKPTNLAFGGRDGRSVFVTLQDRGAIETFRSAHRGRASGGASLALTLTATATPGTP